MDIKQETATGKNICSKCGQRRSNREMQIPEDATIIEVKKAGSKKPRNLFVSFVLDRSGSMRSIRQATIDAVNAFLTKQRKRADADTTYLSFFFFNETVERIVNGIPINKVLNLTRASYHPDHCTALLDAAGQVISETDVQIMNGMMKNREVLLVILTDSKENNSHKYSFDTIADLIRAKIQLGWEFLWIGPDDNSVRYAHSLGIPFENIEIFAKTDEGISDVCSKVSDAVDLKKDCHNTRGWKDGKVR